VSPLGILAGDWMRDLGRLRQVEAIEAASDPLAAKRWFFVTFTDKQGSAHSTLSIPDAVTVTVWRTPMEAAGDSRA
jgi:hypothetical protein